MKTESLITLSRVLGVAVGGWTAYKTYDTWKAAQEMAQQPMATGAQAADILRSTARTYGVLTVGIVGLTAYSWNDPYRLNKALK